MISAVDQSTAALSLSWDSLVRKKWQHPQINEIPILPPISPCSMKVHWWTKKRSLDGMHLFPLWRTQPHANGENAQPLRIVVKIASPASEKGHSEEWLKNVV